MNVIGRIYKTLNIIKIDNGFKMYIKIKSNFGGVSNNLLSIKKGKTNIEIEFNKNLLLDKKYFNKVSKNVVIMNHIEDIELNKYDLIKPDAYNLKVKKIKVESSKKKSIKIPIILSGNNENEINENNKALFIELSPYIYNNEDFIKVEFSGDMLPIEFKTNENIELI